MTQHDTTRTEPSETRPIVRLSGVSKHFGAFRALCDINLEIPRGEFLTLLGPSGSGKTTSLMLLAGFDSPTTGTIEMEGSALKAAGAQARHRRRFSKLRAVPAYHRGREPGVSSCRAPCVEGGNRSTGREGAQPGPPRRPRRAKAVRVFGRAAAARRAGPRAHFQAGLILLDEPLGALDKNFASTCRASSSSCTGNSAYHGVRHPRPVRGSQSLGSCRRLQPGRLEQWIPWNCSTNDRVRPSSPRFIGENNLIDGQVEAITEGFAAIRLEAGTVLNTRIADVRRSATASRSAFGRNM